jgi:single stranded DNA-binding protein
MSSFEQHILLGNLGNDPETKEVGESTVCKFRMAVNKKYGDNEYTTWFAVDAWNKLGETCQTWLRKGSEVLVVADRIQAHPYEDATGELKASLQVTARDVRFVGGKKEEDDLAW